MPFDVLGESGRQKEEHYLEELDSKYSEYKGYSIAQLEDEFRRYNSMIDNSGDNRERVEYLQQKIRYKKVPQYHRLAKLRRVTRTTEMVVEWKCQLST